MGTISTTYKPHDPLNLCSICGTLARKSELRRIPGGLYACNREPCASWRPALELDRANARQKPFRILPVPDARPSVWNLPDSYESDEGEILNFLQRAVTAGVRYESVVSGDPAPLTGQMLPAYGWVARYLYGLIAENKRPLRMITQATAMLTTIATGLQGRQVGFGLSPTSTRATDAFYGAFLESGETTYVTQDAASCGLAMLYAYRLLGATTYLYSARAAASYLRNVQAIGSNGTHYTSSDSAGTARLYTGGVASSVSFVSGFYSNSLFYPQDLAALELWNALTVTDGDQSVGATVAVTGFDSIPAQLMSTSITDMRAFWADGVQDSAGDTFTGLSATTPREYFNAYPATKANFNITGTGRWEFVDGNASLGTTISAQNFTAALAALYAYESATEQVTTISDWLRSFSSNADFEATGNESASQLARSTVGTFDPTWTPTTVLQVRDPDNSYAAIKQNGSSLYDWGALGVISALWGARNTSSFVQARLSPLGRNQRFYDGQRSDGDHFDWITNRGLSGLGLQTAFGVDISIGATPSVAYPPGSSVASVPPGRGSSLIFWVKGDAGLVSSGGKAVSWADQSGYGQNLTDGGGTFPTNGPNTGVANINGIPCISNPLISGDGRAMYVATGLRNRNGAVFGYGVGEQQARTVMVICRPEVMPLFTITGGGVCGFSGSTPEFQCIFDLESTFQANAWYLFSEAWRDPGINGSNANQGPDTVGGIGGIYDSVTVIGIWKSSGFNNIDVLVNAVSQTLRAPTMPGFTGPTVSPVFTVGTNGPTGAGSLHFMGDIAEVLVWDANLVTDDLSNAITYAANRYSSSGVTQVTIGTVNDAVRAAQFGMNFRVNPTDPMQV